MMVTLNGHETGNGGYRQDEPKIHVSQSFTLDFIVTGISKEVLVQKVKPVIGAFLKERGLELSEEKTKITHIKNGFDFLGFNVRKYKDKLFIKPSKNGVKAFLKQIRELIKSNKAVTAEVLIQQMNPKIRGWANYYRHVVAKRTFSYVDHCIFQTLWRWAKRRHPSKNKAWITKRYFRSRGFRQWVFFARQKTKREKDPFLDLFLAADVPIKRHVKIRRFAHPYDPAYYDYFVYRGRAGNRVR